VSGREKKDGFRFPEWMVLFGALGILISVAVPSYLRLEKRERVEELMTSAANFREDLSRWMERVDEAAPPAEATRPGKDGRHEPPVVSSSISQEAMSRFLHLYDMTGERPGAAEAVIVVESAGLDPERCPRDGKIHIIPEEPQDGAVSAVTLLVTDSMPHGGPGNDGLLAVYKIRTER